eukprot:4460452-Karenia_brevis.AAC.1
MGSEIIRILSADAKQRLEHSGQRGFVDATAEEGPPQEEEAGPPQSTLQPSQVPEGGLPTIQEEEPL